MSLSSLELDMVYLFYSLTDFDMYSRSSTDLCAVTMGSKCHRYVLI